jgi:hypothetical protein
MSFLSRRTSRSDQRGGRSRDRHTGSEYDDYDYAPDDDYQQDDDNWSPDEYFSPEGIKGRWAGGDRAGGRGRPDADRYDDRGPGPQRGYGSAARYDRDGRDGYEQDSYARDDRYDTGDYDAGGYGADDYGADDYATGQYAPGDYGTGGYELPDGSDDNREDRGERGGARKRRGGRGERNDRAERSERGERKRRLGRRDKGDDIWPDDGVSDEDYWASVTADRPLTSAAALDGSPLNVVNNRPLARPAGAARPDPDSRPAGGSGRLGPAPGQAGYLSGAAAGGSQAMAPRTSHGTGGRPALSAPAGAPGSDSGPMARQGTGPSRARSASGPNAFGPGAIGPDAFGPNGSGPNGSGRDNFGPNGGARPSTGPHTTHRGTGPHPTRQGTGPQATRQGTGPHPARPGTGPNALRPAAGLAQPNLSQPNLGQPSLTQPTVAQPALAQRSPAQPSFQPNTNTGRGSGRQAEQPDWGERTERMDRIASGYPDPRVNGRSHVASGTPAASIWGLVDPADRRAQELREPGRRAADSGNGRRSTDDDPLTSKAYSREALVNTDGRSYRVASRRAQSSPDRRAAALSEPTETFSMTGQYGADPQAPTAGYPVRGQQPGYPSGNRSGQQQSRQQRQPAAPQDQGTASYPYPSQPYASRPAASDRDDDRYGRPARAGGSEQGYNGNGGYSANGYSGNGYSENGHSANGYSGNGYSSNGYSGNGRSPNGQSVNGRSGNARSANGYSGNGQPGNGRSANGYSANGQSANGYSDNGYSPNGYPANGQSANGYSGNGYSGNSLSPNGYHDDSRYNGNGNGRGGNGDGRGAYGRY